jgi:hypothetical protein
VVFHSSLRKCYERGQSPVLKSLWDYNVEFWTIPHFYMEPNTPGSDENRSWNDPHAGDEKDHNNGDRYALKE